MNLRTVARLCLAAALTLGITGAAHGDTYTFANSNPNSNAYIVGSAPQFRLFSANTYGIYRDVVPNYATYTTTVEGPETVTFNWDYPPVTDGYNAPNPAGYVLNGVYTQLNVFTGIHMYAISGTETLSLLAGDTFGFYIYSHAGVTPPDHGQFAVTLSPASAATPEPGTLLLLGTGLLGFAGAARRRFLA